MKITDFSWFTPSVLLAGSRGLSREFSNVKRIAASQDIWFTDSGSFVIVAAEICRRDSSFLQVLIALMLKQRAAGLGISQLGDEGEQLLPEQLRLLADNNNFPIIRIPCALEDSAIFEEIATKAYSVYSLEKYRRFEEQLLALTAQQHSASQLIALLNRAVGKPIDLLVGREMNPATLYNPIDALTLSGLARLHLEEVLTNSQPLYCRHGEIVASIFNVSFSRFFPAVLVVGLQENQALSDCEITMLKDALPYISIAIQTEDLPRNEWGDAGALLLDNILHAGYQNRETQLAADANAAGQAFYSPRRVLAILPPEDASVAFAQLLELLRQRDDGVLCLEQEGRMTAALCLPAGEAELCQLLEELSAALPGCKLAVSAQCDALSQLYNGFLEASFALALGIRLKPAQAFYLYDHYKLYRMLCDIWDNPILTRVHRCTIHILKEHDKKFGTALLDSLRALVLCDFNYNQAAEAIGAHRNTLYKRAERMEELLGINLKSTESQMLLQLAVMENAIFSIHRQS